MFSSIFGRGCPGLVQILSVLPSLGCPAGSILGTACGFTDAGMLLREYSEQDLRLLGASVPAKGNAGAENTQ